MQHQVYRRFITAFVAMAASLAVAQAEPAWGQDAGEPKEIASNGSWRGYTATENGQKVCFMLSQPTKSEGNYTARGPVYAFVTTRPAAKITDEFTLDAGYPFEKGSKAKVTIGDKDFELVTEANRAWLDSVAADRQVVAALRKGNEMVVQGTSSRGTRTTDTYSLKGFTATQKAVAAACR